MRSIIKPSFPAQTASVPDGSISDLSACRMASPMNFCTVFFHGPGTEGFVNAAPEQKLEGFFGNSHGEPLLA